MASTRTLLALLLALLLGMPPATAGDAPPEEVQSWDRTDAELETTTGPDEDYPVTLDYDLYVPEGASAADPRPAMVVAHGFGGAKDNGESVTLGAFFASRGYIVIASSHQGFGGSSGCIALNSIDYDARNVSRLIDVLADREDVVMDGPGDPRVGMVGGSYGGGHQGLVAASDPRLDAIAPGRTWNSLQFSLVPNNLIGEGGLYDLEHYDQGVFKAGWSSLFFALGSAQPLMGTGGCDPVSQQQLYPGQPPCPGFDPQVCPIYTSLRTTGDVSEDQRAFVARSSVANFTDLVRIPTLLTQGESDTLFTLVEATSTYHALRAAGNEDVFLLWNWGGHGYQPQPGEGEPYPGIYGDDETAQASFRATYFAERFGRFFDHHLRGEGHPGPRFAFFRDWVDYEVPTDEDGLEMGTAAPAYAELGRAPNNAGITYTLTDDGLVAGPVESPVFETTLVNPQDGMPAAHSETPNFSDEGQPGAPIPPTEIEGQHVALDAPPFTAPADVVGFPTLRLHVANANGQDAVLFTKLYDVAPDGSETLVRRLVAGSRIPADQLPGPVEVRLPGVAHRFQTGHAARLVVATTDDSYRNAPVADQVTLSTDPADPSVLRLPLVGGDTVGRIAGADRVETAIALAQEAFGEARAAVIASANGFADALSAGPLAAAIEGPLLLTSGAELDERVSADLRRLGVEQVYLAGGEAALDPSVAAALIQAGVEVTRLAGADRFGTSQAVAHELAAVLGSLLDGAVLARPDDFADALSVGSFAAHRRIPVLLVDDAHVEAVRATLDELATEDSGILVAGGEAAVPQSVVEAVGRSAIRVGGADRYETAAMVASAAVRAGAVPDPLLFASGAAFPDALAAVPVAHALGGLLVVVPPTGVSADSPAASLVAEQAGTADRAFLVGGTAALPDELRGQLAPLLVDPAAAAEAEG